MTLRQMGQLLAVFWTEERQSRQRRWLQGPMSMFEELLREMTQSLLAGVALGDVVRLRQYSIQLQLLHHHLKVLTRLPHPPQSTHSSPSGPTSSAAGSFAFSAPPYPLTATSRLYFCLLPALTSNREGSCLAAGAAGAAGVSLKEGL